MAIKKYRVTDEAENYVELQVDTDVLTPELATEINKFWGNAESRLDEENGDVVAVVARLFGALALQYFQHKGGFSLGHVLTEPARLHWTNRVIDFSMEGWPSTSFELGIKIVDALVVPVDFDTVRLSEIAS
jgi:hypothetical protein